jgi:ankyrin repeat protein
MILTLAVSSIAAAGKGDALIGAVKSRQTQAVRTLIEQRADPNGAEADGTTALHWAVHYDSLEIADLLLRAGGSVNAANRYGMTPLALAAVNGNAAIVERLLSAGADPNTLLVDGETVVMTAARTGNPDVVKMLLSRGANPNASEQSRGQTALMWAAAENNHQAARALIDAGADIHARSHGPAALDTPADPPAGRVAGARSRRGRLDQFTPLVFAARSGALETARVLIDAGADVNATVEDGTSVLVIATMNAHWDVAALLVEAGADPNAAKQGWTALHQLVRTRNLSYGRLPRPVPTGKVSSLDLARMMIAHGVAVDARSTQNFKGDNERSRFAYAGATPFLMAAKSVDHEMMRLLAAAGADPLARTRTNTTALMVAAGIQIFSIGEDSGTKEDALEAVKVALELGADVNAADDNGETALHGAAWRGSNEIVQLLVDRGARLDVKDKKGWTPLGNAHLVYTPGMILQSWPETEALLRTLMEARGLPTNDVPTVEDVRRVYYREMAAK